MSARLRVRAIGSYRTIDAAQAFLTRAGSCLTKSRYLLAIRRENRYFASIRADIRAAPISFRQVILESIVHLPKPRTTACTARPLSDQAVRRCGASAPLWLGATLLLIGTLCPGGCNPATSGEQGLSQDTSPETDVTSEETVGEVLEQNLALLPSASAAVADVVPATEQPAGSLFGMQLDDGNRAHILGGTNAAGEPEITGVALYDPNGDFLLQQEVYDDGTKFTFAAGDAIEFDFSGEDTRLVFTLNASDPPSTMVALVDAAGNVTLDESATAYGTEVRADYGTAKRTMPLGLAGPKYRGRAAVDWDCAQVGDWVLRIGGWTCDLYDLCTSGLPGQAASALCVVLGGALDFAGTKPGITDTEKRVLSALKVATTQMCNALKEAVKVGALVAKVNWIGAACFVLDYGDDATTLASGKSVSQHFCEAVLGGAPPTPDPNASLGPPIVCAWDNPDGTSSETPGTAGSVIEVSGDPAYPTFKLTVSAIVQEFTVGEDTQDKGLFGANVCSPAEVYCTADWSMARTITYGDYSTTGGEPFTIVGYPDPAPALRPGHKIIVVFKIREAPFWKVARLTYVMGSSAYCE